MTQTEEYSGAIGIDLGTTYSCVGVWQNDRIEIIANDQGNRTTPSYVAFSETERLIGDPAKNQAAMNPENTVFDAKRLIGRRFNEPSVQHDMKLWPFKVIEKQDGKPFIRVNYKGEEKDCTPEEISSMVLSKMKETAEAYLGKTVKKAVITVPAYFNDSQRQATKDAGAIAGLEVLRIINEPTAAALAYGLDLSDKKERTVLIFDLGGGTFDVSLLTIADGMFTVKATAGDTHLGGEDFDNRLLNHLKEEFKKKNGGKDISDSARATRRLRSACERAKRTLSTMTKADVEVEALYDGIDFNAVVTRAKFEELCSDLFQGCLVPVEKVLKDAKYKKTDVDDIVLVGGSTRIPKVQALLRDFFGGKELNKSINPDEAVAYGAAVQAAILTGTRSKKTENVLLLDVVPLSLGIEMQGGIMSVVVPRNTTIPCVRTSIFTTTENNQTQVEFPVYEGERPMTRDNNLLGQFELTGIMPAPKGTPQLEVTFNISADGIMSVKACDLATKRTNQIVIKNDGARLSSADIEKMVEDAKRFKEDDAAVRASIAAKEELTSYIYQVQDTLLSDPTVTAKLKKAFDLSEIETALMEAMDWVDNNGGAAPKDEIIAQKKAIEKRIAPLTKYLYQNQSR